MHTETRNIRSALVLTCILTAILGHAAGQRSFFAFDNGLTRTPALEQKAALLKELGYDGICWRPGRTAEMLKALDGHGLRINAIYVTRKVQANSPAVDAELANEFKILKGRGTIIWLGLLRAQGATDDIAVKQLRAIADQAAAAELPVVIYPHVGFYAESMAQVLRLVRKANHPNLGASFNLCHFLKLDDEKNLAAVLKDAAPDLKLVQISGADSGNTKKMGWNRLIQPLGKGTFDMRVLLKILDNIGYQGPVGLQCYNVPGDNRTHLKQSIDAWNALHEE